VRGTRCIEMIGKKCSIKEDACPACLNIAKRTPGNAVRIVNVPVGLAPQAMFRYSANSFKLHRLPMPRAGTVLGLIGTNGIGKTTALKIFSGKLKPNLGDPNGVPWSAVLAQVRGSELQTYFTRLVDGGLRTVTKPQHVDLLKRIKFTGWTVSTLLAAKDEKGALDTVVDALDLGPIMERSVEQLSGGELQRLALALTLVQSSDAYLFDEPSSYLDIAQRMRAARAIRACVSQDTYVVVVEHDLALLDYLSDSLCLFYGERGAFGVATASMGPREGVNTFLDGYLASENVRFRKEALNFKPNVDDIMMEESGDVAAISYPALSKTVGSFSLSVEPGTFEPTEITVLLGQNGTGKTMFVKMLASEVLPGLCLSVKPQYLAPRFKGCVKALLERRIRCAYGSARFREDVLVPLGIEPLLDMPVPQLSGGELQRVALTVTLGTPADLYLIDEPSAYLDSEQRVLAARVMKRFVQLTRRSLLVVEHDFMMATYLADKAIVYTGEPAVRATATSPQAMASGMNEFLRSLDVTLRRDPETHRPRINKPGSVIDREQRASGDFYSTT